MLQLNEKDVQHPEVLGEKLMQLAEIIVRKHFYASYKDKDDLVSEGVLKALTMIDEGKWDRSKGSFLSFIYTGMRNSIHNYLYHQNKFPLVDPESLKETGIDDLYFSDTECPISYGLVHSVCMKFFNAFGQGIEDSVIRQLELLGYVIEGRVQESQYPRGYSSIIHERYEDVTEADIVGRLIGIILWKKRDKEN